MSKHLILPFLQIFKGSLAIIQRYLKIFQKDFHLLEVMIPRSVPPNIRPYRYPYAQKSEIKHMVEETLEAGIIQPSQSSFSSPVVQVHKKDGSWCMCMDYRELDKITIRYKFPILVIDELLDELHGSIYVTKLDLCLGYYHIRMKEEDISKKNS